MTPRMGTGTPSCSLWPEASELGARHGLVGVTQGWVGNEGQERDLTLPVVVCRGKSDVTVCYLAAEITEITTTHKTNEKLNIHFLFQ